METSQTGLSLSLGCLHCNLLHTLRQVDGDTGSLGPSGKHDVTASETEEGTVERHMGLSYHVLAAGCSAVYGPLLFFCLYKNINANVETQPLKFKKVQ